MKKYVIIISSAINIPEQSYDAQYKAGGEVRCETMSNVIVKENETLDSALRRFRETVQRLVFSRRFVRESTTRNQALDVKRNLKLLENVNITNMCKWTEYWKQYSVF